MDQELKAYLDDMNKGFREEVKGLHNVIKENNDRSMASHENTRKTTAYLAKAVGQLWEMATGKPLPPPPPGSGLQGLEADLGIAIAHPTKEEAAVIAARKKTPSLHDLGEQFEGTKGEVDELKGGLLRVSSQVEELTKLQKQQMGIKEGEDTRSVLAKLVDGMIWSIKEHEGRKFSLQAMGALSGIILALASLYSVVTGKLPLPPGYQIGIQPQQQTVPPVQYAPLSPTPGSSPSAPSLSGG